MGVVRPRGNRIGDSSRLSRCSPRALAFFSRLLEICDRAGRFPRSRVDLAVAMFGDRVAAEHVGRMARELEAAGVLKEGSVVDFGYWARVMKRPSLPAKTRARIISRDGGRCRLCPATTDLQVDHVIPVVAGGTDDDNNLQALCGPCNRSKGPRPHGRP